MPISPTQKERNKVERDNIPVKTVLVRTSDGAFFHWDRMSHQEREKANMMLPRSFEGTAAKWKIIIRQMIEHRIAVKVRLIVGFNRVGPPGNKIDEPICEELIFRPRGKS